MYRSSASPDSCGCDGDSWEHSQHPRPLHQGHEEQLQPPPHSPGLVKHPLQALHYQNHPNINLYTQYIIKQFS